jgi:hypothetical protein
MPLPLLLLVLIVDAADYYLMIYYQLLGKCVVGSCSTH